MPDKHGHGHGAGSKSISVEELNNALTLLKQANTILDAVLAGWSVPEPPEQPPFIDALKLIKTQGAQSAAVADRLLATMRR